MELADYGVSQIVYLMNVVRPQGQAYLPEIAAKVISKYQFTKPPSLEDLSKDTVKFQIGKFNDVQINEFSVYGDGILVNGRCPTEVLEDFMNDILKFTKELGAIPVLSHRNEVHFESNIVVQSKADLGAFIIPKAEALIRGYVEQRIQVPLVPSGVVLDFEPNPVKMRRKPSRFFIERRYGVKFEDNVFLCIAPLKTKDHIELLTELENEALKSG